MELDLASRAASPDSLPDDYVWLLPAYPRDGWLAHPNMGGHTRFWLALHRSFRQAATGVERLNEEWREGRIDGDAFRATMAPAMQRFLGALEHHHQMEDHVFFPKFIAADAHYGKGRIRRGIDLLETDHHAIDRTIHETVASANALLQAEGDMRREGEAYAAAAQALTTLMRRHLDDEEEIVMPLILDRGERALGVE